MNLPTRRKSFFQNPERALSFLTQEKRVDEGPIHGGIEEDFLGFDLFEESVHSGELSRKGKSFEDGVVRDGVVGVTGLLGGPIEEPESEGVVVEEERVDDSGDKRRAY